MLPMACGILVPRQGSNLCPPHWKGVVITTGQPRKSQDLLVWIQESLPAVCPALLAWGCRNEHSLALGELIHC